jgi:hypothetical protein
MKTIKGFLSPVAFFLMTTIALAAGPSTISYQGSLTDSGGAAVADGTYDMRFTIFDDPSAGSQLWQETQNSVPVAGGLFSVELGSATALPASIFDTANLYLEIEVDLSGNSTFETNEKYTARQHITAVAFAKMANRAETAENADDTNLLDGLDSASFLRSDADDVCTGVIAFTGEPTGMSPNQAAVHVNPVGVDPNDILFSVWTGSDYVLVGDQGSLEATGIIQAGTMSLPEDYNRFGSGIAESADLDSADDVYIADSLEIEDDLFVAGVAQLGKDSPTAAQAYTSITEGAYTPVSAGLMTSRGDLAIEYDLEVGSDVYVGDNLSVGGSLSWAEKTCYYGATPQDFFPMDESYSYTLVYFALAKGASDSNTQSWFAPVHLPDEATVTEFKVWFYDNSSSDLQFYLIRSGYADTSTGSTMASGASSGTPGEDSVTVTSISNATINNQNYKYSIQLSFPMALSGSNLVFRSARITYTTTGP